MEPAHIDLAYLERFCKGDQARMAKYARMYLDGAPALFAQLEERMNAGDAEGLAIAAHTLRPQVNYMGAQALFSLLTAIEEAARTHGAMACAAQVQEARACHEQVMAALRERFLRP